MAQETAPGVRPLWREAPSAPGRIPVAPRPFARRCLFVIALLLATLAAAAGMLSWLVGTPHINFVSCWVTSFRDPTIVPNTASEQDRLAFQKGDFFARTEVASMPVHSRFLMSQQLSALADSGHSENVVLYLGTYAIVDAEGKIELLTSDYNPGSPRSGLPLHEVLRCLQKSGSMHKLLVLDIFWPSLRPAVSGGAGDVAAAVVKELEAVPDPDRLVLCSCSPGQVALDSETLGRSIFGYYFEQALAGQADSYNPDRLCDGRITVSEVARLTAARVDRWAMRNRSRRQTPVLLGEGEDFELTVCSPPKLQAPEPSKIPKYPAWLLDGWKLRDTWLADGTSHLAPRVFRQLEARLLRIEHKWRLSHDTAGLENVWASQLADMQQLAGKLKAQIVGPTPVSLADAVATGHVLDPKASEATDALLAGLKSIKPTGKPADRQAALGKLLAAFDKQTEKVADLDVALAVFDAAVTETSATADHLAVFQEVLARRKLGDSWIETRFLTRLAELASEVPAASWSSAQADRLQRIVQHTERAFARSSAMPWTASLLESAAQSRHETEVRFWSVGYVPPAAVDQAISDAENACDHALAHQQVFVDARQTYEEAVATLPWYSQYVQHYPAGIAGWSSAVGATTALADLLEAHAGTKAKSRTVGDKDLEAVRRSTNKVRTAMTAVLAPFTTSSVKRLVRRCRSADAKPNVFWEIDAVLATPLLAATDRAELWRARASLAGRFHDALAQTEYSEALHKMTTPVLSGYDPVSAIREESQLAALRARVSLDLLRLGGVAVDPNLVSELAEEDETFTCEQAGAVAALWQDELRKQLEATTRLGRQDRLSRIFPPLRPIGLLDAPETNPTVRLIAAHRRQLWGWLASRYRYETRDGVDPEFYARLAVQFSPYLPKTPELSLQIDGPSALNDVVPGAAATRVSIPWTIAGIIEKRPPVAVELLNPATPALTVEQSSKNQGGVAGGPLVLDVELDKGTKLAALPPQGFMVVWQLEGRTYHRPISIPALADQSSLTVLLSANAKQPQPAVERVRLRPYQPPQALHLYVQNCGLQPKKVVVELNSGSAASAPIEVAPGQSAPVQFAPAPAPAAKGGDAPPAPSKRLPELTGPVDVTVVDADSGETLATAVFPVEILEPRQFVSIGRVRFEPKDDAHNRLEVELRQTGSMPGPPCQVELKLSPDQVPGLLGTGNGVYQGKLPANGNPLVLFAQDLRLADGTTEQGRFSVTVDGVPRTMIFDTTFARSGSPTTPVEDLRPTLRLSAPQTGRSGAPFAAHVETDSAPASAVLEIALGRKTLSGSLDSDSVTKLRGGRRERIGFSSSGKGGALMFDATIGDWDVPLDTSGIVGHRTLRARLLASDGRELASAEQEVVLGNQPPQGVTFENVPKLASNKVPLEVTASVLQSIPEIASVTFFVGKPADNAIPKGAVAAQGAGVNGSSRLWSGKLALKPSVKGNVPISVQFTNAAGISAFETTTIDVTDADVGGGKIEGKVVEGTIPQSGIEVVLADDKGKQQAKATTAADGSFAFNSLKPGQYTTSATKPASGRRGSAAVNVPAKGTAQATIELWL